LKVEENILYVKGLDAINGTPVLDIKPYIKDIEEKD
jgi:tRNA (Thr-GGU) A37 N-methylase